MVTWRKDRRKARQHHIKRAVVNRQRLSITQPEIHLHAHGTRPAVSLIEPGIGDVNADHVGSGQCSSHSNAARTAPNIEDSLARPHPGLLHENLSSGLDQTTDRPVVTFLPQLTLDLFELLELHHRHLQSTTPTSTAYNRH